MKITLEQVKADIKSGKSTRIYYSKSTLWWTHLDADVAEARDQGGKVQDESHQRMLSDPKIPKLKKEQMAAIFKMSRQGPFKLPLDPTGSVLYQMDDCMKWITEAENNTSHFGKYGLKAFMKSHHQNCNGNCFTNWDNYNE